MRQTKLFGKTIKESPKDEVSVNADLLYRGGYVDKLMAGVYSYLPLGLRVLNKVKNIVREEMNAIDAQEILMPALQPRELWDRTGRWEKLQDIMFQFKGRGGADIGLAATHEEVVTDIVARRVKSYKDLPIHLYQVQDKFRNEPRAKSGLMRGREFSMKDLYSFHSSEDDFNAYYEKSKEAYLNIFKRCGLDVYVVEAAGGDFTSRVTHEFQVLAASGEDTIFYCDTCRFAQNKEITTLKEGEKCEKCSKGTIHVDKAVEVGNIFPLETTYSAPLHLTYTDKEGKQQPVIMGSYGVGPSRIIGSIVEVHNDENGIVWPKEVAPYAIHLLALGNDEAVSAEAEVLYKKLSEKYDVLFDDRDSSAGQKFADSDLLGIPIRLVVSKKTLKEQRFELKARNNAEAAMVALTDVVAAVATAYSDYHV